MRTEARRDLYMMEREISGGENVLIYVCWVLAMVLGFLALVSGRELLLSFLAVQGADLKLVGLIDKIIFFFIGVIELCVIVLAEGYFRTGAKQGDLLSRLGLVFGGALLFLFLFDLGRLLIPGVVGETRPQVIQVVMSLVIGSFGLGVFFRSRR